LVEVTWLLQDPGTKQAFELFRRQGSKDQFVSISHPDITQNGNEFIFRDHSAEPGRTYDYRVVVMEDGQALTSFETTVSTPSMVFSLEQNQPNPFNPVTKIRFSIDRDAVVMLSIYDVSGKRVKTLVNRPLKAGRYTEEWNGRDAQGRELASGVYFYRLKAGSKIITKKMVLLK
jgi:hypothetical protein